MSAARDTGGPAFPFGKALAVGDRSITTIDGGITVRDYFAAKVICGLSFMIFPLIFPGLSAQFAYMLADAMLKERAR